MASATTTTETWHPLLAQHLNLLPEHLRSHKDCQAFLLELNKSVQTNEQAKNFAEHSLRILQIEKAELERKIAATNEKFALASKASKAGVWEWSGATGQIIWDDQMFTIYGIENQEQYPSISKVFFNFVVPEDRSTLSKSFASITGSGNAFQAEFRIIRQNDNSIRNLHLVALVKRGFRNEPTRMVGVCFDFTERKKAEAERALLISNLVNYNKDLEELAFVVSHRLRSHTSKMQTALSVLSNAASAEALKNIIMQEMEKEALLMDETLRDLTHILTMKKENLLFEELELKPLLQNAIERCAIQTPDIAANIELLADETLTIVGVREYVLNIFYELLQNAIKFKKDQQPLQIKIKASESNSTVTVVFIDNGIGVDLNKHSHKIFGLYRKFNSNIEGKGIGLHMVKKGMDIMGGKIHILSEPNSGTEVHLTFIKQ